MFDVNRVFLSFVFVGITLLGDEFWVEFLDKIGTDNTAGLAAASTPTPTQKQENPPSTSPVVEPKPPVEKSPSIIQMLEGRENDLTIWVSIAAVAFVIGWILGGNYYLRRDRARSKKLRF